MAKAPVRPLAWEPPYAVGVALEKAKSQKKKKKKKKKASETKDFNVVVQTFIDMLSDSTLQLNF